MPHLTETHPDYSDSYESMLDNLDQPEEFELTDWEANFLDSMLKLNERGDGFITDKQAETIRKLVDKYLSN
jgi:hypothetical protein